MDNFQVSYVLIVQPPEEKDKNDDSGMNVYDFDADGDVDFVDSDGDDDSRGKMRPPGKRSQTVSALIDLKHWAKLKISTKMYYYSFFSQG